jgi:hypothetical protein
MNWTLKQLKKAPYYLFKQEPADRSYGDPSDQKYTLIFKDGDKVKIATFEDDMYGRGGGNVFGHLTSPSPMDFWQRRKGLVSADMHREMVAVFEGTSTLPEFDFLDIKVRGM